MKLTILETGAPPDAIAPDFPAYPEMFEALLKSVAPHLAFETISVFRGDPLPDPARLQGVLITGSPAGVYDDLPWITPLLDFLRAARDVETPMAGICFGHQALAQALGGHVEKSAKGWGVGRHTYQVNTCPDWAEGLCGETFSAAVSHQDQVTLKPPGAEILAASAFTELAALYYPDAPALSFQCHPEFDDAFAAALYAARRERLSAPVAEAAIASLAVPADSQRIAQLITRFFAAHS